MVDDQLEIEVDKICEYQRKHDTLAFYKRMQLFCSECLLLINREYLKCDEIEIINQIRQIWASNNYDIEVSFYNFRKDSSYDNKGNEHKKTCGFRGNTICSNTL